MGIMIRTVDGDPNRSPSRLLVIILPVVLGTLVVLTLTLISFGIMKRRRKIKRHFHHARLRDPSLTWEEFERRGNLTRSRLLFEEELLRNAIIRKTQQNRESGSKESVPTDVVRPTRSRSKTWHGRTRNQDIEIEDGRQLLHQTGTDWGSAQANVERTWQLLHGKKCPPLGGNRSLWDEDDEGAPQRPPTVRLKTPPLLSHPVFKGSPGQVPPKHLSLPTELIRVKTEPGIVSGSAEMQQSD
ncbi:hypothetical protein VSDG_05912 [Cytospora chrysosperma]|uniref:Uncharacterized protein n=1 Tax=Cytospora chrysosperma TaxID=252740 RepID=A0A423VTT0_CYTCH|nr:hypothetical protein VSDG_05912 [Valsa sordida]